ncbi:siderophore ABC transporter substrate-binding protein [Rubellimicrobium aerolatum]|uniref:Siderophore ABC transporter substrate-binding protein n=1 Tax=Rubellimicrobium aerolatum TaxID=490979 RepID=A0ABW0SCP2_9RHOB|nr:siderophore ABC transporter substrate-binding protein [Rubellimicrobium aerolatum]MBP1806352.1 iron complex transport system substrate-binding protein [Rubellimicrobium aerolatum]
MRRLSALTAATLLLASPAFAQTVTVETARGPVEVPQQPASLVVFDVAAMDTLDALGATAAGVPNQVSLDYLQDFVAEAEPVGTLFEPDFEAVNALAPDLVIAGGRSAAQAEALAGVAPTIDMTIPGTDLVGTALSRLDAYGAILGREAEAQALKADVEAKLAQARVAVAGKGTALVVLTNGPKMSAYGAGSRFGWLHADLGLPQAVEGLATDTHGEAIGFEFIRDADPDWLIVIDRAAAIGSEDARAQATLDNALVSETTAWREGQVIYLPAAESYVAGGGVQALSRNLDRIIKAFGSAS